LFTLTCVIDQLPLFTPEHCLTLTLTTLTTSEATTYQLYYSLEVQLAELRVGEGFGPSEPGFMQHGHLVFVGGIISQKQEGVVPCHMGHFDCRFMAVFHRTLDMDVLGRHLGSLNTRQNFPSSRLDYDGVSDVVRHRKT
jgi:hypothetical protein